MSLRAQGVLTIALAGTGLLLAGSSRGDSERSRVAPPPAAYVEECGACHVAYPARLLDARSWSAVLGGLERHFGVDASVDAETLAALRVHLEGNASRRPTSGGGGPLLRISETRWFRHEHAEVPRGLWQEPHAVKPSDCAACHPGAAQGRFSERELRLPRKGELR
jgi:hypothetical protein